MHQFWFLSWDEYSTECDMFTIEESVSSTQEFSKLTLQHFLKSKTIVNLNVHLKT